MRAGRFRRFVRILAKCSPNSAKCWPNSAKVRPTWIRSGPNSANFVQFRPSSTKCDQSQTGFDHITLAEFGQLTVDCADVNSFRADFDHISGPLFFSNSHQTWAWFDHLGMGFEPEGGRRAGPQGCFCTTRQTLGAPWGQETGALENVPTRCGRSAEQVGQTLGTRARGTRSVHVCCGMLSSTCASRGVAAGGVGGSTRVASQHVLWLGPGRAPLLQHEMKPRSGIVPPCGRSPSPRQAVPMSNS